MDHHTSNFITMESIKNSDMMNVKYELDIKLSGCQLAWNHFYPDLLRPWFLEYISDRDLWKFELENSKEINEAPDNFPSISLRTILRSAAVQQNKFYQ